MLNLSHFLEDHLETLHIRMSGRLVATVTMNAEPTFWALDVLVIDTHIILRNLLTDVHKNRKSLFVGIEKAQKANTFEYIYLH